MQFKTPRYSVPRTRKPAAFCRRCGKPCARRSYLFCSNACQKALEYEQNYSRWLAGETAWVDGRGLRKALLQRYGCKCGVCGLTEWMGKPIPLEVNHKDGNSDDHRAQNLELICLNCHGQTPTYRALNYGKGRHSRRLRDRKYYGCTPSKRWASLNGKATLS